jgi:hypothetical protein
MLEHEFVAEEEDFTEAAPENLQEETVRLRRDSSDADQPDNPSEKVFIFKFYYSISNVGEPVILARLQFYLVKNFGPDSSSGSINDHFHHTQYKIILVSMKFLLLKKNISGDFIPKYLYLIIMLNLTATLSIF